jgi:hypothetical protein
MAWHFLPNKSKSAISYLLIILAFALLVLGVFIFFKFRIKVIEKEKINQAVTQTKQLKLIISKSAYHDYQIDK